MRQEHSAINSQIASSRPVRIDSVIWFYLAFVHDRKEIDSCCCTTSCKDSACGAQVTVTEFAASPPPPPFFFFLNLLFINNFYASAGNPSASRQVHTFFEVKSSSHKTKFVAFHGMVPHPLLPLCAKLHCQCKPTFFCILYNNNAQGYKAYIRKVHHVIRCRTNKHYITV